MINITDQLRKDRRQYIEDRKNAARFATLYPNTDMGKAMAEHCRLLDAAIANIDFALNIKEGN
jgi:hypothetical protein